MSLENISKQTSRFYAPQYKVLIEGKDASHIVKEVTVEEDKEKLSRFSMTVAVNYDREKGAFEWLDHPLFQAGNNVEIKMGYIEPITMIKAKIYEVKANFFSGNAPVLNVSGFDGACRLLKKTPQKPFVKKSYSDIVEKIADEVKINAKVDPTHTFKKDLIRKNTDKSYYQFIKLLADEVNFEFRIGRDGVLYFVKRNDEAEEILTLTWEKDLISFNPKMNISELISEVEVRAHNEKNPKEPIVGIAKIGDEHKQDKKIKKDKKASQVAETFCPDTKKVVSLNHAVSKKEAEEIAESILQKASDSLVKGDGECVGIPQIEPMKSIRLENLGKKFSGKYYIVSTRHTCNDSGYRTSFTVSKNSIGLSEAAGWKR